MSSGGTICTKYLVQVCEPCKLNTEDIIYFEWKLWRHLPVKLSHRNVCKRRPKKI